MLKPSKSFLLPWILATIVGSVIGFLIGGLSFRFFDDYHNGFQWLGFLTSAGVLISLSQWIILRPRLIRAWIWIPSTAIGIMLGFTWGYWGIRRLLGDSFDYEHPWLSTFLMSSFAGLLIGTLQWLVLARIVKGSFLWIFVSALSWGIGITVSFYFGAYFMEIHKIDFGYFDPVILYIIPGALIGTINGAFVESTFLSTAHENVDLPIPAS